MKRETMSNFIKQIAIVLLVVAAILSLWALSKCVNATSITINDTCASYTVSNANGVMSIACATVTTPPPHPSGDVVCPGFANTINIVFDYIPNSLQVVKITPDLETTDIVVARFTTPATIAAGYGQNGLAGVSHNYYAKPSVGFSATFSKTPCKTTNSSWANADGSSTKDGTPGQSVSWSFNTYKLQPNTTYYYNIKGDSPLYINLTAK